jgi:hypothetical protein
MTMENQQLHSLLAVVRIVCVLGMAFGVAGGIFLLLGGWWLTGLLALLAATPFFLGMRYMEKQAAATYEPPPEPTPAEDDYSI